MGKIRFLGILMVVEHSPLGRGTSCFSGLDGKG